MVIKKGHSWCTQVRSRSRSSTGCPICREQKLAAKRQRRFEEACHKISSKSTPTKTKKQIHITEAQL